MFYSKNTFSIVNTKSVILTIPPAQGLTAYCTDTTEYLVADGTEWQVSNEVAHVDIVRFNSSTAVSSQSGDILWNNEVGTIDLKMGYDNVSQQIGLSQYMTVKNNTLSTISKGKVVMFSGVSGELPTIQLGIADGTLPSIYTIGITAMNVPASENGYALTYGHIHDINTSAWNVGDILYVSTSTAGELTNVKPTVPNLTIPVAAVLKKDVSTGIILVRPTLSLPLHYGVFSDTSTQTATVNSPKAITFNTTDVSNGITIGVTTSRIYCSQSGLYNFQFSLQVRSSTSSLRNIYIWPAINGTAVPNSATEITLKSNVECEVPSWNFNLTMQAGQYFELMWTANDTGITITASPAQVSPFVMPAIPSAILTVNQINQ